MPVVKAPCARCCRYFHSCEALDVKLFRVDRDRIDVHANDEVPRMTFPESMPGAQQARQALAAMPRLGSL